MHRPFLAVALVSLFAASCAVVPIVEDGRTGTPLPARAPGSSVLIGGHDHAHSRLDDTVTAVCGARSPAARDALIADVKAVDWDKGVFTSGRLHFTGEILVRRAKNDRAAMDEAAAIQVAEDRARALGANLLYEHRVKREGVDEKSLKLAAIEYLSYAVDCDDPGATTPPPASSPTSPTAPTAPTTPPASSP